MNLRDPLDYTKTELEQLSIQELEQLLKVSSDLERQRNIEQMALKILINSLYGATGNKKFPLFNEDMARAITSNGRYFITKLARYIEEGLQSLKYSEKPYIVYGDTDSVYYHVEPFMNKYIEDNPGLTMSEYVDFADHFEKKIIQPLIQKCIDDFAREYHAYNKDMIGCEREVIADSAVFTKKKKYYIRVRDSEGVRYPDDNPYIKKMGLDVIKSTTPTWSKKYLEYSIPKILDESELELRQWIQEIKQEFTKVNPVDISIIGGVSNLDYKLGDKGIPIGSRSALVHNKFIKDYSLDNLIAPIVPGDKCKRLFLVEPNKLESNIFSYTNEQIIPHLLKHVDIDYDTQFNKGFLKLMELMTDCLGYDLEKETANLDDW